MTPTLGSDDRRPDVNDGRRTFRIFSRQTVTAHHNNVIVVSITLSGTMRWCVPGPAAVVLIGCLFLEDDRLRSALRHNVFEKPNETIMLLLHF